MSNKEENSFIKRVNPWLQAIALIVGAMWAAWSFWFDKVSTPKTAPVNTSLKIDLKKLQPKECKSPSSHFFIPIEMKVSATNPSSRTIYFLNNAWIAYGRRIENPSSFTQDEICKYAEVLLNDKKSTDTFSTCFSSKYKYFIATGKIFIDHSLKPNETITRTLVFYVPKDIYDMVAVTTVIPTIATNTSGITAKWNLTKDDPNKDFTLVPRLFKIPKVSSVSGIFDSGGQIEPVEVKHKPDGTYGDDDLQMPISMHVIAL